MQHMVPVGDCFVVQCCLFLSPMLIFKEFASCLGFSHFILKSFLLLASFVLLLLVPLVPCAFVGLRPSIPFTAFCFVTDSGSCLVLRLTSNTSVLFRFAFANPPIKLGLLVQTLPWLPQVYFCLSRGGTQPVSSSLPPPPLTAQHLLRDFQTGALLLRNKQQHQRKHGSRDTRAGADTFKIDMGPKECFFFLLLPLFSSSNSAMERTARRRGAKIRHSLMCCDSCVKDGLGSDASEWVSASRGGLCGRDHEAFCSDIRVFFKKFSQ